MGRGQNFNIALSNWGRFPIKYLLGKFEPIPTKCWIETCTLYTVIKRIYKKCLLIIDPFITLLYELHCFA